MSKPDAPAAPNPYAVTRAQGQEYRNTAEFNAVLNRVNQTGPQGSTSYQIVGYDPTTGAPQYEQSTQYAPGIQRIYDSAVRQSQTPFSYGGIEDLRNQSQNALYDRNTAYLDQDYSKGEDALRSRLANQGIVEGSEAYSNAMDDFNRGREMAYRQARNESIAGAGGESDRMLRNALTMRQLPAQEANQLLTVGTPSFQPYATSQAQSPDLAGNVYNSYQGDINAYNSRQAGTNNLVSTLGSLAAAGIMFSDERLKEDIEPVGHLNSGDEIYLFRYKGDEEPRIGLMAQDVEKRDPSAVITTRSGYKAVDYGKRLREAAHA